MRVDLHGFERRRVWSDEDKLAIVSSAGMDGATVKQVAHRHGVSCQQIYGWRRELKKKGLWSAETGAMFLPIDHFAFETPSASTSERDPCLAVELRLSSGRCLRFNSSIDPSVLTGLIQAVENA